MAYFVYGEKEINWLKQKDRKLGEAIDKIGRIERETIPDLFAALVNAIVGQQISMKAQAAIWQRLLDKAGEVTPGRMLEMSCEELRSCGISQRKISYIQDAAEKMVKGELKLEELAQKEDEEVCKILCGLKGVGVWTAEMLMLFSMQRLDVFSYGDLAVRRGLCILHHHKEMPRERFERYRRRYSPYGSIACLYLWEIASGALSSE